ncbi:MAG: MltR family transcriptional regulator [Candidatus Methylomirabilales bacterium]
MGNRESPFERFLEPSLRELETWLRQIEPRFVRGSVIASTALLDRELANLLKAFFISETTLANELLKGFGPLATFDARIEAAFALGLISELERRRLELIRRIRNDFAHVPEDVSFETAQIRDRCMELQPPRPCAGLFDAPNDNPHGRFLNTSSFLFIVLFIRGRRTTHRDIPPSMTEEDVEAFVREARREEQ